MYAAHKVRFLKKGSKLEGGFKTALGIFIADEIASL
jgi:hypothetical protein